jgi:hypothetical protein
MRPLLDLARVRFVWSESGLRKSHGSLNTARVFAPTQRDNRKSTTWP